MKSGLKIISIALIMLTGTSNAFAGPFGRLREARPHPQPHINQQEQRQQQRQQQFQQPAPKPLQQPPQNPVAPPPASGPGAQFPGHPFEGGRNPGQRMSVEDRQKLRRQINEAGQDIYTQKK